MRSTRAIQQRRLVNLSQKNKQLIAENQKLKEELRLYKDSLLNLQARIIKMEEEHKEMISKTDSLREEYISVIRSTKKQKKEYGKEMSALLKKMRKQIEE